MTLQNPYEVPLSAVEAPPQSSGEIPDSLVHDMQVTRTWVRLLSILAFILTGLLIIGGVGMMIAGSFSKELPSWAGAIYLVFAAVYVPRPCFCIATRARSPVFCPSGRSRGSGSLLLIRSPSGASSASAPRSCSSSTASRWPP